MCHIFGRESSLSRHRGFDGDEAFVDGIDAKAEGLQRSGADQDERVRLAAQDHGRDFRTIDRDVGLGDRNRILRAIGIVNSSSAGRGDSDPGDQVRRNLREQGSRVYQSLQLKLPVRMERMLD